MSDQNMTRRSAVKLGGTALAAVGLSAGAGTAVPDPPAPVQVTDNPDFRGKAVYFYGRGGATSQLLIDPVVVMQAGRLFVTGTLPSYGSWGDGLLSAIAWDLVESYLVYNSAEDYFARHKECKGKKKAESEATAQSEK